MGSLLHFSAFWLWSSLRSMEAMEVTAMEATAMEACLVAFMEVSDRSSAMEAVDTRDLLIPTQLLHLVQQLTTVQLYMRFILQATLTPAPYTMLYTMLAQFTMPCPPVVLYL